MLNVLIPGSLASIALVAAYLWCLKPNTKRRRDLEPFEKVFFAHRGLFDNNSDHPENSLAAFRRAVEAGYGIELDVQLTSDHRLVVFHDGSLNRMCGVDGMLYRYTYDELCQYSLADSDERIPLLQDVLELVAGKVPLIVEIKKEGSWLKTTKALAEMMQNYHGLYCIESFHPLVVAWYRKHHPDIIRGQLSSNFLKENDGWSTVARFILSNLLLNWLSRPDFIAYNHRYANQFSYRLCRKLFPTVNAAWTIRSQEELDKAEEIFQIIIFDSFIPDEK